MIDHELSNLNEINYKDIEDIIDARKELGQYNVNKQPNSINYRYVYSTSSGGNDRFVRFNDMITVNEGDAPTTSIKHTDSEITVVRIRQDNNSMKKPHLHVSKWDMHDVAIPGDGSHLGESPSMVNLATLVAQNLHSETDEYLVPLSSWDPCLKSEEKKNTEETKFKYLPEDVSWEDQLDLKEEGNIKESNSEPEIKSFTSVMARRPSLAGRISKFIRKHCKKPKTLNDEELDKN
ncbi:unnamed protein product [Brassicogethes aeneus]|uniref:Uncharacterized protein n=1 Tax=Brassicogethes aeneus TaxID=1431903 RepID=A0A9P0FJY5_BRAAE|nr:unnamed protein product [Brassicogethes aeneus]